MNTLSTFPASVRTTIGQRWTLPTMGQLCRASVLSLFFINNQPIGRWFETLWGSCGVNEVFGRVLHTLRPRQDGRHFPDDIFKCIFLNENVWIPTLISPKFVPRGPINNNPSLVQIKAWRRPGDKPLSEPMMVSVLTHICVMRPQWINETVWYQTTTRYNQSLSWWTL